MHLFVWFQFRMKRLPKMSHVVYVSWWNFDVFKCNKGKQMKQISFCNFLLSVLEQCINSKFLKYRVLPVPRWNNKFAVYFNGIFLETEKLQSLDREFAMINLDNLWYRPKLHEQERNNCYARHFYSSGSSSCPLFWPSRPFLWPNCLLLRHFDVLCYHYTFGKAVSMIKHPLHYEQWN